METRYLLTGDSGFLGRILLKKLALEEGIITISLNDSNGGNRIDISDEFKLHNESSFDVVIHAAGMAHRVPRNNREEEMFYKVNYKGTVNLCKALENLKTQPKAFIFISTVAVYGLSSGLNIGEDSPLIGNSPYAKSKVMAEEFLNSWANEHNVTLGILRLPLLVGPDAPGNFGAMVKGIISGRYLRIGDSGAIKSVVWAEDITSILPRLSEIGGVYNLTDGYNPSFYDLESAIAARYNISKIKGISINGAKFVAKIGDFLGNRFPLNSDKLSKMTSSLTFDSSKAQSLLYWKPHNVLDCINSF